MLHPRYYERVLAAQECRAVRRHDERALWTHWAAKEAAYKAMRQVHVGVIFSPRLFVLHRDRRCVDYLGAQLPVVVSIVDDAVHVVCAPHKVQSNMSVAIIRLRTSDASQQARALLRQSISRSLQLASSALTFDYSYQTGGRPIPIVQYKRRRLPISLSISHHGRYCATAWSVVDDFDRNISMDTAID
jgi:phosphopantetheinyl transferase (holo-ACP synthase)